MSKIYFITYDDIKNKELVDSFIHPNEDLNYYCSDDFSCDFYIELAYEGFISVSEKYEEKYYLLPEIQFEYAVLEFENLHISKKVKKLINKDEYIFKINSNFELLLESILNYHDDSWMRGSYESLLKELNNYKSRYRDFELYTIELYDKNTNELIAGEIGYKIGKVYTSLSGFTTRNKKYNNYGKLQLVLLGIFLEENGFAFWNLGHPYMQYKFDLGAKALKRKEFLKKFNKFKNETLLI